MEARSFIEPEHLICLGVMDEERNSSFPDVPTYKEKGYNITYFTQCGMAVPKGNRPGCQGEIGRRMCKSN